MSVLDNVIKERDLQAWTDLEIKYPNKWIIYDYMKVVSDDRLTLCHVIEICDDDAIIDRYENLLISGLKVGICRTSTSGGIL